MKLNVLLAKTEHSKPQFKKMIQDYLRFFSKEQGAFTGVRKTYVPRPGTIDIPSNHQHRAVSATVDEKLNWFDETASEHIDNLFSLAATNASGNVKAELIVEGKSFGEYSTLELLELKNILESGELENMYMSIPVRSDAELWTPSDVEGFDRLGIYATRLMEGVNKGILKETIILPDPNIAAVGAKYTPVTGTKDTVIEYGDYTTQMFSGEWSHRQRAELLRRRTKLLSAIKAAIETANATEQVKSQMTASKLFGYLRTGEVF